MATPTPTSPERPLVLSPKGQAAASKGNARRANSDSSSIGSNIVKGAAAAASSSSSTSGRLPRTAGTAKLSRLALENSLEIAGAPPLRLWHKSLCDANARSILDSLQAADGQPGAILLPDSLGVLQPLTATQIGGASEAVSVSPRYQLAPSADEVVDTKMVLKLLDRAPPESQRTRAEEALDAPLVGEWWVCAQQLPKRLVISRVMKGSARMLPLVYLELSSVSGSAMHVRGEFLPWTACDARGQKKTFLLKLAGVEVEDAPNEPRAQQDWHLLLSGAGDDSAASASAQPHAQPWIEMEKIREAQKPVLLKLVSLLESELGRHAHDQQARIHLRQWLDMCSQPRVSTATEKLSVEGVQLRYAIAYRQLMAVLNRAWLRRIVSELGDSRVLLNDKDAQEAKDLRLSALDGHLYVRFFQPLEVTRHGDGSSSLRVAAGVWDTWRHQCFLVKLEHHQNNLPMMCECGRADICAHRLLLLMMLGSEVGKVSGLCGHECNLSGAHRLIHYMQKQLQSSQQPPTVYELACEPLSLLAALPPPEQVAKVLDENMVALKEIPDETGDYHPRPFDHLNEVSRNWQPLTLHLHTPINDVIQKSKEELNGTCGFCQEDVLDVDASSPASLGICCACCQFMHSKCLLDYTASMRNLPHQLTLLHRCPFCNNPTSQMLILPLEILQNEQNATAKAVAASATSAEARAASCAGELSVAETECDRSSQSASPDMSASASLATGHNEASPSVSPTSQLAVFPMHSERPRLGAEDEKAMLAGTHAMAGASGSAGQQLITSSEDASSLGPREAQHISSPDSTSAEGAGLFSVNKLLGTTASELSALLGDALYLAPSKLFTNGSLRALFFQVAEGTDLVEAAHTTGADVIGFFAPGEGWAEWNAELNPNAGVQLHDFVFNFNVPVDVRRRVYFAPVQMRPAHIFATRDLTTYRRADGAFALLCSDKELGSTTEGFRLHIDSENGDAPQHYLSSALHGAVARCEVGLPQFYAKLNLLGSQNNYPVLLDHASSTCDVTVLRDVTPPDPGQAHQHAALHADDELQQRWTSGSPGLLLAKDSALLLHSRVRVHCCDGDRFARLSSIGSWRFVAEGDQPAHNVTAHFILHLGREFMGRPQRTRVFRGHSGAVVSMDQPGKATHQLIIGTVRGGTEPQASEQHVIVSPLCSSFAAVQASGVLHSQPALCTCNWDDQRRLVPSEKRSRWYVIKGALAGLRKCFGGHEELESKAKLLNAQHNFSHARMGGHQRADGR